MSGDKKEIKEKLKREFDKSGAGIGGLVRSMGLGPKDSDFDKIADEILRTSQPKPQMQYPQTKPISLKKPKLTPPKTYYTTTPSYTSRTSQSDPWDDKINEIAAYREAALKFSNKGQFKDALKYIKEAIGHAKYDDFHDLDFDLFLALTKDLGDLYLGMGDEGKAKKAYEKILKKFHSMLERHLIDMDEKADIPYDLYVTKKRAPWGWGASWDSIAWLFMRVDDPKRTARMIEEAFHKQPESTRKLPVDIARWARLGAAYLAMDKTKEAEEVFKRAEALSAEDKDLSKQVMKIIKTARATWSVGRDQTELLKKAEPLFNDIRSMISSINDVILKLRELGLADKEIMKKVDFDKILL